MNKKLVKNFKIFLKKIESFEIKFSIRDIVYFFDFKNKKFRSDVNKWYREVVTPQRVEEKITINLLAGPHYNDNLENYIYRPLDKK